LRPLRQVTTRRFAQTVAAIAHHENFTRQTATSRIQKLRARNNSYNGRKSRFSPLRVLEKKLLDIGRTNRTMASYRKYGGRQSSTLIVESISIVELHCGT